MRLNIKHLNYLVRQTETSIGSVGCTFLKWFFGIMSIWKIVESWRSCDDKVWVDRRDMVFPKFRDICLLSGIRDYAGTTQ